MWGGFECSVIRTKDRQRDQFRETGHQYRRHDLDAAAALGIRTLRYPFLWERLHDGAGWDWQDDRVAHLGRLGLDVVAGLVHHGSGPPHTNLLDPGFAPGLAQHAHRVSERYRHIQDWTPVNEPLTTARFSCLYGFWHPHTRKLPEFLRSVVIQCHAVLLSMRAVRRNVPNARLIQTEDVARVFATDRMQYQADYENERRWLSLDLLFGRVDRHHPWRRVLEDAGAPIAVLDELASGEGAPDVVGVNYYATSDRFLDHRANRYPAHLRGYNGRHRYGDVEAVRAHLPSGSIGWLPRLREVWARYETPIVITEAQLACEDDVEQARWLLDAWSAALRLRREGGDVRAVTAWALAGSMDWDSLVQHDRQHYEPGAFNSRSGMLQPRTVAHVIASLSTGIMPDLPELQEPGWWQRHDRFMFEQGEPAAVLSASAP